MEKLPWNTTKKKGEDNRKSENVQDITRSMEKLPWSTTKKIKAEDNRISENITWPIENSRVDITIWVQKPCRRETLLKHLQERLNLATTICYRNKNKVKLATVVEGDQKAPFSIATALKGRGGRYSFPWIALLYPWYIPYIASVKQRGIKYHF